MNYTDFISGKSKLLSYSGIGASNLNENLFDFQEWIVKKALKAGRYAVFADCGLGKTIMQLSWADQVIKSTGRPVLILAPLAVSEQTILQGRQFGISVYDWTESPDDKLQCLCKHCHKLVSTTAKGYTKDLIKIEKIIMLDTCIYIMVYKDHTAFVSDGPTGIDVVIFKKNSPVLKKTLRLQQWLKIRHSYFTQETLVLELSFSATKN